MAALTDAQLPLTAAIQSCHRENGRRLRQLLAKALEVNAISRVDLADEAGIDPSQLTRALEGDGVNLQPALLACVIAKDRARVFVGGLAAMIGCDLVERRPDLAAENRALRSKLVALRAELDELLEGE